MDAPLGTYHVTTPERDAQRSVARESTVAIATPAYTREALLQMGYRRSYGMGRKYRRVFAHAFADAWLARYAALTESRVGA
jgi:hypothetical protein